jgi:2'-5' RNA ligase
MTICLLVFFFLFRARQSLIDVCHQIALAKLPPPQITFTGLSHFNNKVLYIDPVKDCHLDVLTRIAGIIPLTILSFLYCLFEEICRETYEKNGILTTDTRPFNPHLTLFKLSKAPDLYRKGLIISSRLITKIVFFT